MKSLFIGGSVDGEFIETSGEERRYVAKLPDFSSRDYNPTEAFTEVSDETYYRVSFTVGGSMTSMYAHSSLAKQTSGPDELAELVLHKLIAGYTPGKAEGEQRQRPTLGESIGEPKLSDLKELSSAEFRERLKRIMEEPPKMEPLPTAARTTAMQLALEAQDRMRRETLADFKQARSSVQQTLEQRMMLELMDKQATFERLVERASQDMRADCQCPICTVERKAQRGESPSAADMMAVVEYITQYERMERQRAKRDQFIDEYSYMKEPRIRIRDDPKPKAQETLPPPSTSYDYRAANAAPRSAKRSKR